MEYMRLNLAIAVALVVGAQPVGPAKVGSMALDKLVRYSDAIVVARVTRVVSLDRPESERRVHQKEDSFDSWMSGPSVRLAEAEVMRVVKGERTATKVHFLAQPTWTCDISGATVGETDLLFLSEASWPAEEGPSLRQSMRAFTGGAPILNIMHSGRGNMPVRKVDGRDYATYWDEVVMPKELAYIDGPDGRDKSWILSTPLAELETIVRETMKKHGAMVRVSESGSTPQSKSWTVSTWSDCFESCWVKGQRNFEYRVPNKRASVPWSALDNDEFVSWPDAAPSLDSISTTCALAIATDGHRRTLHLPGPAQLTAPLEPKLEQEIRVWLALSDLISADDASDARTAYRALLSKPR
jgi:hypothetical protein